MTPDDPRHGTNAGYIAHALGKRDYCQPCRSAHVRKRKETSLKHLRGQRAKVDATGTVRRVQALLALGHTHPEIAAASGGVRHISKNVILSRYTFMHTDVVAAIDRAYQSLSMVIPTGWRAEECRRRAISRGYLPPLAWADIDDPDERPITREPRKRSRADVDPVVILRVMAGDKLPMTRAERVAVVAQMLAAGWSQERIEQHTGITRVDRLIQREAS